MQQDFFVIHYTLCTISYTLFVVHYTLFAVHYLQYSKERRKLFYFFKHQSRC